MRFALHFVLTLGTCFSLLFAICLQPVEASGFFQDSPSNQPSSGAAFTEIEPPPITRIIMFNSGLCQVVHQGKIVGNGQVNMQFSDHDIDDVLKSLVFEDKNDGWVQSVKYNPAPDKQDVAAKNLGQALTLAETLQKYRGETVSIKTDTETLKGAILSVENRQAGEAFTETLTIVNDQGFVSVAINDFKSISFENEKVREHFQLAMEGLQENRNANSRRLSLLFEGEGEREIRFSYNVDSPIWRMTYRLDIKQHDSTIQGWAHIDNVTGVDWNEIELDLRSGRPQSFHSEIFAPVLAERIDLGLKPFDLPRDKTLLSTDFFDRSGTAQQGGFGGIGGFAGGEIGGGGFGGSGFGGGGFGVGRRGNSGEDSFDINSAFQSVGTVCRSNKMVRFALEDRVSIKSGNSAMVPVLTESVPIELYSKFNGRSPSAAKLVAQLKNNSSTPLIPGPVTLYQGGDFVGDSALQRVEAGGKGQLVYGTDLSVNLRVKNPVETATLQEVTVDKNGDAVLSFLNVRTNQYLFINEDSLPRKFMLEAPLIEQDVSPTPDKRVDDTGIYTLDCDANSKVELVVTQKRTEKKIVSIDSLDKGDLVFWKNNGVKISDEFAKQLDALFEAKKNLYAAITEKANVGSEVDDTINEQNRITQLMKAIQPDSPAMETYLAKLNESETQLADARKRFEVVYERVKELTAKVDQLKEQLGKPDNALK